MAVNMNTGKLLAGGVAAGVVLNLIDFLSNGDVRRAPVLCVRNDSYLRLQGNGDHVVGIVVELQPGLARQPPSRIDGGSVDLLREGRGCRDDVAERHNR